MMHSKKFISWNNEDRNNLGIKYILQKSRVLIPPYEGLIIIYNISCFLLYISFTISYMKFNPSTFTFLGNIKARK
jgi:hypothetical protein